MAPTARTEAVASLAEPDFEDRLDHQPDRLLDDTVFDRGDAQRSHSAIALGDLDPFDGLRTVAALPHGRAQLGQIHIFPRCEPIHALPIHARRPFVRLDLRPGEFQGRGRVHLVYQ
jgi:hypothetical protein